MSFRVGVAIVALYAVVRVMSGMVIGVTARLTARRAIRNARNIRPAPAAG